MEENRCYCPHCLAELPEKESQCPVCGRDTRLENEPHQLPVGALLQNRYRIGRCIGEGGFGITYAGRDTLLDMKVAIKEYFPSGLVTRYHTCSSEITIGKGEKRDLFLIGKSRVLDEARVLAKFSGNPNVVDVRDLFEANNTAYIVMEYLDGQTLQQVEAANGPLPFEQLYRLLRPVMGALAEIHRRNLIHRDISPSNMMLLRNGTVKLLDFGTMREFDPNGDKSMSVVLKPGYAPEEQFRSHGAQGPWTDVYAMCASIYRLMTGVTPENAMNRVFDDKLEPPSRLGAIISPSQEQALMRGLAVQASDRIQNMEALQLAFEGVEEDDDDERTVGRPRHSADRPAEREDIPVYVPRSEPASQPSPKRAEHVPDRQPGRAQYPDPRDDAYGKTVPQLPVNATDGAGSKPDGKAKEKARRAAPVKASRPKKTTGSGARRKPLPFILIGVGVAAVLAIGFLFLPKIFSHDNLYTSYGNVARVTSDNDMDKALKAIKRDADVKNLVLYGCEVSDASMRTIAGIEQIESLEMEKCTGLTDLSPIADLPNLKKVQITGDVESGGPCLVDGLLSVDLSQVDYLSLFRCRTEDGGDFLNHFPSLKTLSVHTCEGDWDMENVGRLSGLTYLSLIGIPVENNDFSPLSACVNVRDLTVEETGLDDVSWVASMEALRLVDLKDNALVRLDGFENHAELSNLSASGNRIEDISGLAGCGKLDTLNLSDNPVGDISVLSDCPGLKELQLAGSTMSDISALAGCAELTTLNLTGAPVSDITALSGCEKMKRLVLNGMRLTDLDACEAMIYLEQLEARDNLLTDINGLKNTTQLMGVALSGNQITDIEPLSKNTEKLAAAFLSDNQIDDLSPLKGATKLNALSFENNQVTSLRPLEGMESLAYLAAGNNRIADIGALANLNSLSYLDLGGNQISDISPLVNHAASNQILLLHDNQIRDISYLSAKTRYRCLSLYGNAIKDFSRLGNLEGISYNDSLYISWADGWDYTPIVLSKYSNVSIIDMPIDQRAPLEVQIKEIRKENNVGGFYQAPAFITEDEADADMEEIRSKAREQEKTASSGLSLVSLLGH